MSIRCEAAFAGLIGAMLFFSIGALHAGTWGDDFNDGKLEGWSVSNGNERGTAIWRAEEGVLHLSLTPPRREFFYSLLELVAFPIELTDFRVRCTILDRGIGGVGLLIGKQPGPRDDKWKSAFKFYQVMTEGPTPAGPPLDVRARYDQIWQMEVAFKEGHFRLFSKGEQVAEFRDKAFQTITLIGITSRSDFPTFDVDFDNFTLWGPDVPDGPAFAVQPQAKLAATWGGIKLKQLASR